MFKNFKEKSPIIKITQIILFITTALYLLESIFLAGLFTNITVSSKWRRVSQVGLGYFM